MAMKNFKRILKFCALGALLAALTLSATGCLIRPDPVNGADKDYPTALTFNTYTTPAPTLNISASITAPAAVIEQPVVTPNPNAAATFSIGGNTVPIDDNGLGVAGIGLGTAEPGASPTAEPALKRGSSGERVTALQQKLKNLGYYTGTVDGDYGDGTVKAVKAFQSRNGLTADGVAGEATLKLIDSGNAKKAATPSPKPTATPTPTSSALRVGSTGPNVVQAQVILNRISQNYPAIPKINPVDGIFGTQTEEATRAFQRIFNLTADGIIGKATWYRLVRLYVGVNRLAELESEGQTFYAVNWQYQNALQEGSRGEKVRALQYMLSVLAEFISSIPRVNIDGIFGQETANAVTAFQRFAGLDANGVVNEATWDALYDQFAGIEINTGFDTNRFTAPVEADELDAQPAAVVDNGQNITNADTAFLTQFPGQTLRYGDTDFEGRGAL